MKTYLAYDLGASSGRLMAANIEAESIELREIHRFDNHVLVIDDHECWDMELLEQELLTGLEKVRELNLDIVSIGIDTWGVDFVLLDKDYKLVCPAVMYRDKRSHGMLSLANEKISFDEHYSRSGIAFNEINTVYHLLACQKEWPEQFNRAEYLLFIPDYIHFKMTGKLHNEYTISGTSALLNADSRNWDFPLIEKLGLPTKIFQNIIYPGTKIGKLCGKYKEALGKDVDLIAVPTHDTASAYLGTPINRGDKNSLILSSGTWSLLGIILDEPITQDININNSVIKRNLNFTNEGIYNRKISYLRNIMGLWMLQSVRRELNGVNYIKNEKSIVSHSKRDELFKDKKNDKYSFPDLISLAKEAAHFETLINVNYSGFLSPESMTEEILNYCEDHSLKEPSNIAELISCIYKSLTNFYRETINNLASSLNRKFDKLYIVGGGSQDDYLNQLTADSCNLQVIAGPTEASSLGNIFCQIIEHDENFKQENIETLIRNNFPIKVFYPQK